MELKEKDNIKLDFIPLLPKRPLREIKGPLYSLVDAARLEGGSEDYIRGILTDAKLLNDPMGQLRALYPNIMTIEMQAQESYVEKEFSYSAEDTSPQELFQLFFERQNHREMDEMQKQAAQKAWEGLEGDVE